MEIKPFGNRIYLKISRQTKTKTGVALPESKDYVSEIAEIIAVGDKVTHFDVGDHVMFKYYALDTITVDDVKYDFIEEEHVVATVEV